MEWEGLVTLESEIKRCKSWGIPLLMIIMSVFIYVYYSFIIVGRPYSCV